jgi:hypothetical protein
MSNSLPCKIYLSVSGRHETLLENHVLIQLSKGEQASKTQNYEVCRCALPVIRIASSPYRSSCCMWDVPLAPLPFRSPCGDVVTTERAAPHVPGIPLPLASCAAAYVQKHHFHSSSICIGRRDGMARRDSGSLFLRRRETKLRTSRSGGNFAFLLTFFSRTTTCHTLLCLAVSCVVFFY